jgi:hypothetical protein
MERKENVTLGNLFDVGKSVFLEKVSSLPLPKNCYLSLVVMVASGFATMTTSETRENNALYRWNR